MLELAVQVFNPSTTAVLVSPALASHETPASMFEWHVSGTIDDYILVSDAQSSSQGFSDVDVSPATELTWDNVINQVLDDYADTWDRLADL